MGVFDFVKIFRVNKSISIDLGTANILIYDKQRKKIVLNEPSVVARDRKTGRLIAVGKEAREMLGKTPDSIQAIKPLQDGVIADIDSTKEMITYFIHKIYGNSLFKPEVMICVPIEVTSVERKALFDAVKGAKKTYIIEEGRAAIIGSGVDIMLMVRRVTSIIIAQRLPIVWIRKRIYHLNSHKEISLLRLLMI